MTKVILNTVGAGLDELKPLVASLNYNPLEVPRHDPRLVALVELLQAPTNGFHTNLTVTEVPDGGEYAIVGEPERIVIRADHNWIIANTVITTNLTGVTTPEQAARIANIFSGGIATSSELDDIVDKKTPFNPAQVLDQSHLDFMAMTGQRRQLSKGDIEHLEWLYARFENAHLENPKVDHMRTFRRIIDTLHSSVNPSDQLTDTLSLIARNSPDVQSAQMAQDTLDKVRK